MRSRRDIHVIRVKKREINNQIKRKGEPIKLKKAIHNE